MLYMRKKRKKSHLFLSQRVKGSLISAKEARHMNQHAPNLLPDQRIVELYFERDEQAIRETDRKYGAMLLSISRSILSDERDCEECRNDTYLKVWNAIPPTRPQSFRAYIAQIIRHLSINRYRERTTRGRVPSEYTASLEELADVLCAADSVERDAENARLGRLINTYLGTLPPRGRYLFVGRFYMARTLEALAEELHVHSSTVYRELEKIKRGLREYLERNGIEI